MESIVFSSGRKNKLLISIISGIFFIFFKDYHTNQKEMDKLWT